MIEAYETLRKPLGYDAILEKSKEIGFGMSSDMAVGSLLRVLVASKPSGNFLEMGTGTGLALTWMVDGMNSEATLTTVDNNPELIAVAQRYFGEDPRINICCEDAEEWMANYKGEQFDLVFADTWVGKYTQLQTLLEQIKSGGFYVVDDMRKQPNWPEGHEEKAKNLIKVLEDRQDLKIVKLDWATGVVLAVKN